MKQFIIASSLMSLFMLIACDHFHKVEEAVRLNPPSSDRACIEKAITSTQGVIAQKSFFREKTFYSYYTVLEGKYTGIVQLGKNTQGRLQLQNYVPLAPEDENNADIGKLKKLVKLLSYSLEQNCTHKP